MAMAFSSSYAVSDYGKLKNYSVYVNLPQYAYSVCRSRPSDFMFVPVERKTCSVGFNLQQSGHRSILHASAYDLNVVGSASSKSNDYPDYVPSPIVTIYPDFECDATVVEYSFGDGLGALINMMKAFKGLGLNVLKGTISTEGSVKQTAFFIRQLNTGRKVEDPDILERIQLLLLMNPESSEQLAAGEAFGVKSPKRKLAFSIAAVVDVQEEDGPKRSLLFIETADRPGLLLKIFKVIAQVNIDIESAQIVTEGLLAKDKFHVSYRGQALNTLKTVVLKHSLRYFIRMPEAERVVTEDT